MQTLMFVFVGLNERTQDSEITDSLEKLLQGLNSDKTMSAFEMMKSGGGLTARDEGIAYYIAVINKKSELKEWFQLARNFELSGERFPVTKADLQKRYDKIDANIKPYNSHQLIAAMKIFDQVNSFMSLSIYCFQ